MLLVAACGSSSTTGSGPDSATQDAFGFIGTGAGGKVSTRFVIPPGTAARLDAGEKVNILPSKLHYRVGEVIQVVNQDDRGETVGPFVVGPNATVTERFATPGIYDGLCTVHPGGKIEIVVSA